MASFARQRHMMTNNATSSHHTNIHYLPWGIDIIDYVVDDLP